MKNLSLVAGLLSMLFITVCSQHVTAQRSNTWLGGTPGMENDWNCPRNWSQGRVPDEFSDVIIPDVSSTSLANPVIREGTCLLNSLMLQSKALLIVMKGAELIVFGEANGINRFNLLSDGPVIVIDEHNQQVELKTATSF